MILRFFLAIFMIISSANSLACSCANIQIQKKLKNNPSNFIVQVTDVQLVNNEYWQYTYSSIDWVKPSKVIENVVIKSMVGTGAACEANKAMEKGKSYLVSSHQNSSPFTINLCNLPYSIVEGGKVLDYFDQKTYLVSELK